MKPRKKFKIGDVVEFKKELFGSYWTVDYGWTLKTPYKVTNINSPEQLGDKEMIEFEPVDQSTTPNHRIRSHKASYFDFNEEYLKKELSKVFG